MQQKKDESKNVKSEETKIEQGASFDSTTIKDGKPVQKETREKDLYREEHGDLTNEPT